MRILVAALLILTCSAFATEESPLDPENFKGALCFIAGSVKPLSPADENAFTGMIRLRFEAPGLDECRLAVELHCKGKWAKIGYIPQKIEGYFESVHGTGKRTPFTLARDCSTAPAPTKKR